MSLSSRVTIYLTNGIDVITPTAMDTKYSNKYGGGHMSRAYDV